jgi:acyl-CoA reductase-like NAD-dependent aldehyde dehydrogenase
MGILLPKLLYIDGAWCLPDSRESEPVINPATEELIAMAPVAGKLEADAAITAARHAFDHGPWPRMSGHERASVMAKFLDALRARETQIRALITAEAGATLMGQHAQFALPMQHAQFFIDICARDPVRGLPASVNPTMTGAKMLGGGVTVRAPVGVVVAITPYNFPFFLNVTKIFPAIAAGNTVVLKPSPYTPFQGLILGEAAEEAGLPNGVFNVITGGKDVGEILTTDRRVDLITFTGSDSVGAAIQAQAASTLKRLLLELGGKSALIVRHDANLDQAAAIGAFNFTWHAGQGCNLATRQLVHNSIRAEYVRKVADIARSTKLGNPADPSVGMGPLIRAAQRSRTEHYIELGLQEGATLATGGKRPDMEKGFFMQPTLFDNVDNSSRIAREEIFGPVGIVIGFDTDEEAIALANDSDFGLGGGIISADAGRAYEMALQMHTGEVYLNGGSGGMSSHAPFGGIKRSGYGREFGEEGFNEFTYLKSIIFHAG